MLANLKIAFKKMNQEVKRDYLHFDYLYLPCNKFMKEIKVGYYVHKDEIVGFYNNDLIYSPVSGFIKEIRKEKILLAEECPCLVIENDYTEKRKVGYLSSKINSRKSFLEQLKRFSINELELFAKLEKNLVIDCVENEPYYYHSIVLKDYIEDLLMFSSNIKDYFSLDHFVFVVKENDNELINLLKQYMGTYPELELKLVEDVYYVNKKKYYKELYEDVQSIHFLTFIYLFKAFIQGKLGIHQYLTISMNDIRILVSKIPFGVKLSDLKECLKLESKTVIVNGLLGGINITDDNQVLTKKIESLFFVENEIIPSECINCGKCVEVCPLNCNPKWLLDHQNNRYVKNCSECGLCNFICPANIDLKGIIRRNKNE